MTVYYDRVLPQVRPVYAGYGFIVGSAPTRVGDEPVFQVLSETDVRTPVRPADTDRFRRWEVAGGAHSGYNGQVYRAPIQERDLGAAPVYTCAQPPFSRVPVQHVTAAAYAHLERWVRRGTPPPTAPPIAFNPDGTKARDALGLVRGGIRLSQVDVPTALNTGDNAGSRSASCSAPTNRSTRPHWTVSTARTWVTSLGWWPPTSGTSLPATYSPPTRRKTCARPCGPASATEGEPGGANPNRRRRAHLSDRVCWVWSTRRAGNTTSCT